MQRIEVIFYKVLEKKIRQTLLCLSTILGTDSSSSGDVHGLKYRKKKLQFNASVTIILN